jgi:hypothetical protein
MKGVQGVPLSTLKVDAAIDLLLLHGNWAQNQIIQGG